MGYRQILLPPKACTYHIHHLDGWSFLTAIEKLKFLEKCSGLGIDAVVFAALQAIKARQTYNLNAPDWGFAALTLPEEQF